MVCLKTVLYFGISLSIWIICAADINTAPSVINVRWLSLDFKTVLVWTATPSNHTYTVRYSERDGDFEETPDCIQLSESECDLTNHLQPFDRTYIADIQTEPLSFTNYDYNLEEFPHTLSLPFNPYRQSNISAVKFTVETHDETSVIVNITDPLTSIHKQGKQLTIRDIFKKDLKYKISYYKSGSTGKRDIISDSSEAEVSKLDPGQSYCFMVAAFIPSRSKATQLGAWSAQVCSHQHPILQGLNIGAWVGAVFIVLTVLIIIITVMVLCCRCCQQRNQNLRTSQSSAPV